MVNTLERAREVASAVVDPELPALTLADLGVLRDVEQAEDGTVLVTLTPTYSGCPALAEMHADVRNALRHEGFERVAVRTVLAPAWTTDWISADGRRKLAEYGIAPPGPAPTRTTGPVPLRLDAPEPTVACPHCGSKRTTERARFSSTACKSLHSCRDCGEPFEHLKAL